VKNTKRILSVTIRRMFDDSPDTSHLGEYGREAETEYSIDRKHKLDCIANDQEQQGKLGRIADFLEDGECCSMHSLPQELFCSKCRWHTTMLEAAEQVRELAECDGCAYIERNTYQFFNPPVENYLGESPEDIRKYVRQDFARMESLNSGDWSYIGIRAEAIVEAGGSGISQRVSSGGLYGIESDLGQAYFDEVGREELAGLRDELIGLGFSRRAISTAFKSVKEKA
jgi:hypothetical protein